MNAIRSILWIGRAEAFAAELAIQAPRFDFVWESDPECAQKLILQTFDAIVLDVEDARAAAHGLALLGAHAPCPPLLVRVHRGVDSREREGLIAAGAADVLLRQPEFGCDDLVERLERLTHHADLTTGPLAARLAAGTPPPEMIGESRVMRHVFALAQRASATRASVLLTGETGTGKELVAQAIHRTSPRHAGPLLAVNCAAFPETLLESELLGHTKGAFTGADRDKKGLFEEADGGTLFLDEIGETSPPFQAKLLRVLQDHRVRPVGSTRTRHIDVRVIAATNRDLWREAREGRFREDLYYRLAVFPIHIPPLRERPPDLAPLVEHFLRIHGERDAKPGCRLSTRALHLLQAYRWPGNVRELENELERALALAERGEILTPAYFSERLSASLAPVAAIESALVPGESLRNTVDRIEAWLVRRALESHAGRRAETARRLGLTREGLYKKMKRLGIE